MVCMEELIVIQVYTIMEVSTTEIQTHNHTAKAKAMYIRMRVEQLAREEAQKQYSALGVDDGTENEDEDDDGALMAVKRIEEKIPPQVLNAIQIGGFVIGMIAIWYFRHYLGNIGRRLRQAISGGE